MVTESILSPSTVVCLKNVYLFVHAFRRSLGRLVFVYWFAFACLWGWARSPSTSGILGSAGPFCRWLLGNILRPQCVFGVFFWARKGIRIGHNSSHIAAYLAFFQRWCGHLQTKKSGGVEARQDLHVSWQLRGYLLLRSVLDLGSVMSFVERVVCAKEAPWSRYCVCI